VLLLLLLLLLLVLLLLEGGNDENGLDVVGVVYSRGVSLFMRNEAAVRMGREIKRVIGERIIASVGCYYCL
jgi:hypothetical protein